MRLNVPNMHLNNCYPNTELPILPSNLKPQARNVKIQPKDAITPEHHKKKVR